MYLVRCDHLLAGRADCTTVKGRVHHHERRRLEGKQTQYEVYLIPCELMLAGRADCITMKWPS